MHKNKIVVIGANQGALVFARLTAQEGFEVELFEAKAKNDVAYNWTDDMIASTFDKIGIERPEFTREFKKHGVSIITPEKDFYLDMPEPEEEFDVPVARKALNNALADEAVKAGALIHYLSPVKCAVTDYGRVTGIILENGSAISADLVVDCSGAASSVRASLPQELHIPPTVLPDETFFVRRTFFERPSNTAKPERTNKIYLKHLESKGISWCTLSPDELYADVLVGRLNGLSDEEYAIALDDLRSDNDIIGDNAVKGGEMLRIPVRRPISRMIADGYVLLGDSAYMTIPLIGSGIANGMHAAKILTQTLTAGKGDIFCAKNLYRYQLRYMKEIGSEHASLDLLKNRLLGLKKGEVDFLLKKGVISTSMLEVTNGADMAVSPAEALKAVIHGLSKPALLITLAKLIIDMNKENKICKSMPESFNDEKLLIWQNAYDKLFI